jgi:hypothetical protein
VIFPCHSHHDYHNHRRGYATTQQESRRRAVTPFNDDGNVPWTELSAGEKTARAAQQTFNFGMVILGVALTGGVGYVLYSEVFSPDSKTTYFNRAVDRIRKDPRCVELLGDGKKITAFGEETYNKWRRARPIAYVYGFSERRVGDVLIFFSAFRSTVTKDGQGNEHMMIHFNVGGRRCWSAHERWLTLNRSKVRKAQEGSTCTSSNALVSTSTNTSTFSSMSGAIRGYTLRMPMRRAHSRQRKKASSCLASIGVN